MTGLAKKILGAYGAIGDECLSDAEKTVIALRVLMDISTDVLPCHLETLLKRELTSVQATFDEHAVDSLDAYTALPSELRRRIFNRISFIYVCLLQAN